MSETGKRLFVAVTVNENTDPSDLALDLERLFMGSEPTVYTLENLLADVRDGRLAEDRPAAPEFIVYEDDRGRVRFVCPHPGCTSDAFYEEDQSIRWNEVELDYDDSYDHEFAVTIHQRDGEYETLRYSCQECRGEVSVPLDWFVIEWC